MAQEGGRGRARFSGRWMGGARGVGTGGRRVAKRNTRPAPWTRGRGMKCESRIAVRTWVSWLTPQMGDLKLCHVLKWPRGIHLSVGYTRSAPAAGVVRPQEVEPSDAFAARTPQRSTCQRRCARWSPSPILAQAPRGRPCARLHDAERDAAQLEVSGQHAFRETDKVPRAAGTQLRCLIQRASRLGGRASSPRRVRAECKAKG